MPEFNSLDPNHLKSLICFFYLELPDIRLRLRRHRGDSTEKGSKGQNRIKGGKHRKIKADPIEIVIDSDAVKDNGRIQIPNRKFSLKHKY